MNGIPSRASAPSGRLVTRIGCIRAREAHKARTLHSITRRGPDSERIRAFLFFPELVGNRFTSRPTGMHRLRVGTGGSLFNKLPRTRLHNWVQGAFATQADIAQQAERGQAMAEAPGSMPGIRSRHLIAGVFRHNGRACVPRRAGAAGMCGAGTLALAQREHITAGHRARAGAQPQ